MPGFNLQTYKDRFLAVTRAGLHSRESSAEVDDSYVFGYLNEAQALWQDRLKVVKVRDTSLSLTSGTATYALPATVLGQEIETVSIADSTNGTWSRPPLTRVTFDQLQLMFDLGAPESGTPQYWALDLTNERLFWLLPKPSYTRANAIAITYRGQAPQLLRCYNQSAITVLTATYAGSDKTITLTGGSPGAANIVAGDEFGVCASLQSDGGAVGGSPAPPHWYEIATYAGSTAIVLQSAWNQVSISSGTSRFITAQVSEVERTLPGKMGFGIVDSALAAYFESQGDAKSADRRYEMAERRMSAVKVIQPNLSLPAPVVRGRFPWLGGTM